MAENLIVTPSRYRAAETLTRLEAAIKAAGMSVFARIDHAAGAASVGMNLRPTMVVIFGNAKAGTPLMQAREAVGLDLPLRMLVIEEESGKAALIHRDPKTLAAWHDLGPESMKILEAMAAGMLTLARAAAGET